MTDLGRLKELKGLITEDVGIALYGLAKLVPGDQSIVELGSYHGKSTAYLAAGALNGNQPRVFAVDAWSKRVMAWSRYHQPPELKRFRQNLKSVGLAGQVIPVRGLTTAVAKRYKGEPVGLLYVDADHSEEAVLADVHAWRPHLAPGALVAFDDYGVTHNPGVELAVAKLCDEDGFLEARSLWASRVLVCKLR